VQSSRVAVTVGQPVWEVTVEADGTALVSVMAVLPSGRSDWAAASDALMMGSEG